MKARLYTFHSSWELAASKREVWQILTAQPFSWQEWWPAIKDVDNLKLAKGLSGTTFNCLWQAPIGYHLKCEVTIGKIIDFKRVSLHTDGDVQGSVSCWLSEVAGQTTIKIDWRVRTTKAWMNYLAPLLRPLFIYNHHVVMRSGERSLKNYLNGKA